MAFVYMVHTNIVPAIAEEYRDWQETEHVPWLLGVPGYRHNRRLQSTKDPCSFLNIWTIESEEDFGSPVKQQVSNSPWSVRLRRYRTTDIHFYDEMGSCGKRKVPSLDSHLCTLLLLPTARCEQAFRTLSGSLPVPSLQLLRARQEEPDILVMEYAPENRGAVELSLQRLSLQPAEREDYLMLPALEPKRPFTNEGVRNVWPLP